MSDQDIINLGDQITAFAVAQQTKMDQLNAARDSANAAAETRLAFQPRKALFVDPVDGDDANPGTSATSAVRSWAGLFSKIQSGGYSYVRIIDDGLVADTSQNLSFPNCKIEFVGTTKNGTGFVRRKIKFTDATNAAVYVGGITSHGSISLVAYEVDFEVATTKSATCVQVLHGHLVIAVRNSTLSKTGSGSSVLFGGVYTGHYEVAATVIDPSISGSVIFGVPSGGDPNALNGVSANFTQA